MNDSSNAHQFARVNINGTAAELIRKVMRQTGWTVEQSLSHLFARVVNHAEGNNGLVAIDDMAIEGNEVGVQVVANTITPNSFNRGDIVKVTVPTEDDDEVLKLYGVVNGFATGGVVVKLTERSMNVVESYGFAEVKREDVWDYADVTVL